MSGDGSRENTTKMALAKPDLGDRLRRYRRSIAVSHVLTRLLTWAAPSAFPAIFVIGYPRSGTNWVCRILADVWKIPHIEMSVTPVGSPGVINGHQRVTRHTERSIYLVRDGRDVLVSLYYWYQARAGHLRPMARRRVHRDVARLVDREADIKDAMPEFIDLMMTRRHEGGYGWAEHVRSYKRHGEGRIPLIRYEDLHSDPIKTIQTAVDVFGEEIAPERLKTAIDRNEFAVFTGRSGGEVEYAAAARRGVVGEWREVFSREALKRFIDYGGDELKAMNYSLD